MWFSLHDQAFQNLLGKEFLWKGPAVVLKCENPRQSIGLLDWLGRKLHKSRFTLFCFCTSLLLVFFVWCVSSQTPSHRNRKEKYRRFFPLWRVCVLTSHSPSHFCLDGVQRWWPPVMFRHGEQQRFSDNNVQPVMIVTVYWTSLSVQRGTRGFALNPQGSPLKWTVVSPLYRWGAWG